MGLIVRPPADGQASFRTSSLKVVPVLEGTAVTGKPDHLASIPYQASGWRRRRSIRQRERILGSQLLLLADD